MDFQRIAHMEFAKLRGATFRYDLSRSGVPGATLSDFPPFREAVEPSESGIYGHAELKRLLANAYGTGTRHVLLAAGTSLANFLVMAALLRPGDDALVEAPAYEYLHGIPRSLGANVLRFRREMDAGYLPDLEALARAITPATRLIVLSNLHNPSGALLPLETLRALGEIARERRIHVMVDEVYLDYLAPAGRWDGIRPPAMPAATLGPEFITTSSLTKVYGLGGLRAGWAVAHPAVVERAARVADYLDVNGAAPSARLAVRVLADPAILWQRSRELCARGMETLSRWLATRDDLACRLPAGGMVAFARITSCVSSRALAAHLASRHRTLVLPGEFFESPGHLRLGVPLPPGDLAEALARLGTGLDELRAALPPGPEGAILRA